MKKLLLNCSMVLALCAFGACGGEETSNNPEDVVVDAGNVFDASQNEEPLDGGGSGLDAGEEEDEKVPCLSKLQCVGDEQCIDGYCTLVSCTDSYNCKNLNKYYCTTDKHCAEYECHADKPCASHEGCVDHQCVEYECYDGKPCLDDWMTCSDNHKCVTKEGMCAINNDYTDTLRCIDHIIVEKDCHATKPCPNPYDACSDFGDCVPASCSSDAPCPGYNYDCIGNKCIEWECHDNKACADSSKTCYFHKGSGKCVNKNCSNTNECNFGSECFQGLCRESVLGDTCSTNSDCPYDYNCISEKCVHRETKPLIVTGKVNFTSSTTLVDFLLDVSDPAKLAIDCGNGRVEDKTKCRFSSPYNSSIKIYGQIRSAQFCKYPERYTLNLAGGFSFGSSRWLDLTYMFKDCGTFNLTSSSNANFSSVLNAYGMFSNVKVQKLPKTLWKTLTRDEGVNFNYMFNDATIESNSGLSDWKNDLGHVTSMIGMFKNATIQSGNDLNYWLTSNVTDMGSMFEGAKCGALSVQGMDTSSVTRMAYMFKDSDFVGTGIDSFNTYNVTDMAHMFAGATQFNWFLGGNWNLSKVTSTQSMFSGATSYNNRGKSLGSLGTTMGNVTDMSDMFYNATAFNQDINNWNVSNVTDMSFMFCGATAFNRSLNNWNVSNVTNMKSMFSDTDNFNGELNWGNKTSNVTSMRAMFSKAKAFNQDISGWDVSNVQEMAAMFADAESFNNGNKNGLYTWNTGKVTTFANMFQSAKSFNRSVSNWDISNAKLMDQMFLDASSFNQPISGWKFGTETIDAWQMFSNASSMKSEISGWKLNLMNGLLFPNTYPCSAMKNYTPADFDLSKLGCSTN